MPIYHPPMDNIKFILHDVLEAEKLTEIPGYEDATAELVDQILEEGGRLCENILFPIS